MSTYTEITIAAAKYEDFDDCLAAAAADYARENGLEDWQVAARWEDDQREAITLTVPAAHG
jgi:hypothetical protein